MKLNIYKWEVLNSHFPKLSFTKPQLKSIILDQIFMSPDGQISIIFTTEDHIKDLNKEFREKNSSTDVLSFVIEEKPLLGEIYVCPEYIQRNYSEEEVLRDIVHGILHLLGDDHKSSFDPKSKEKENMFVKQENILENILYEINNRAGKSRKKISSNKT